MKLNKNAFSVEPLVGCANYYPECTSQGYPWYMTMGTEVLEYLLQYKTDPVALAELLPEPFMPTTDPIVTVLFTYLKGSDVNSCYSGRGDYSLSCVGLSCKFDGEEDHIEGIYNWVPLKTMVQSECRIKISCFCTKICGCTLCTARIFV